VDKAAFLALAAEIAAETKSLYNNTSRQRELLLGFAEANGWLEFGADCLKSSITLWLSAYKQPGSVKIELMLKQYDGVYPDVCAAYSGFISGKDVNSANAYWELLDFMLAELERDITAYSELEIDSLVKTANDSLTLKAARLLSEFLFSIKTDSGSLTKWIYTFDARSHPGLNSDAYALADYAVMAYSVFNNEAWQKQDMVANAVRKKVFADLWLFSAFNLICALRPVDLARLPAPNMPYDTDFIRADLLSGAFSPKHAAAMCDEMTERTALKAMRPSKTQKHSNIPDIKLFVPESLRIPLGTIIAVALTHLPEGFAGQGFIHCESSLYYTRTFFGEEYAEALGKRRFSSRRANKAYLQGIDLTASIEGTPGRPKGYMLAALARSHKSGIASLPKTTDIYLKDANFAGYTPEFIAREMFERGVFSFIPAMLLEMYAGGQYKALPVHFQTKLITALGLNAEQIEQTAYLTEKSLSESKRVVSGLFTNAADIKGSVFQTLQNIASGNAPGRQSDYLCLMTAAARRCPYPKRSACVGCEFEILTKAAMHSLMREYVRISGLRKSANATESARYGKLLENAVLPAVAEFIASSQLLYPGINADVLLEIMEEGLDYANSKTREIGGTSRTHTTYIST
jgi:hypothetical protein